MATEKVTVLYQIKDLASKGIKKLRQSFVGLGISIAAVTAGIVAMGKDFAQLQTKMVDVGNLFGASKKEVDKMTESLIHMSKTLPVSIHDLSASLFDVVSAGVPAAESLKFLETSAKLAVAGVTDTKTAVDGLTSVINAYTLEFTKAEEISDKFFAAQKVGKTTIKELSSSIGRLAPIAFAAGLSIDEMLASVSALTLSGIKTEEAVVGMRTALISIVSPVEQAKEEAKKLGIEFNVSALKAKGLKRFLEDVVIAADGDTEALSKLFGNVRGLNAVLALSAGEFKKLEKSMTSLEDSSEETAKAFARQMETMSRQTSILKNNIIALSRAFIQKLEPAITATIKGINSLIKKAPSLINKFKFIRGLTKGKVVVGGEEFGATEEAERPISKEQEKVLGEAGIGGEGMLTPEQKAEKLRAELLRENEIKEEARQADLAAQEAVRQTTIAAIEAADIREKESTDKTKKDMQTFEERFAAKKNAINDALKDKSKQRLLSEKEMNAAQAGILIGFANDIAMSQIGSAEDAAKAVGNALKNAALKQVQIWTAQSISNAFANHAFPLSLGIASLMAVRGAIVSSAISAISFATGGVVPGSSFSGDKVPANVNSGEMVLTQAQQAKLFSMANNGETTNAVDEGEEGETQVKIVLDDGTELAKGIWHKQKEMQRTGEIN